MSNPSSTLVVPIVLFVLTASPLPALDATRRSEDGTSLAVAWSGGGFETLEIPFGFRGVAFVNWQETVNTASLRIAIP